MATTSMNDVPTRLRTPKVPLPNVYAVLMKQRGAALAAAAADVQVAADAVAVLFTPQP